MKKTQEIIGLPVIDLSSGEQIGKVWDMIFNSDKGTVEYFIVDDGMIILGAKVVNSSDVQGIGEYALTISKKDAMRDASKVETAIKMFKKNIKLKNTNVLTQKGRLVGRTRDIFINPKDCSISALEFSFFNNQEEIKVIPSKEVIAFGENLIVVTENLEEILQDASDKDKQLDKAKENSYNKVSLKGKVLEKPQKAASPNNIKETQEKVGIEESEKYSLNKLSEELKEAPEVPEVSNDDKDSLDAAEKEKLEEVKQKNEEKQIHNNDAMNSGNETFKEGISATAFTYKSGNQPRLESRQKSGNRHNNAKSSNLFEEKQREFLIGRKVTKTIKDKQGNQILNQGDIITEEAVDRAKDAGKLIEIVMNNRA